MIPVIKLIHDDERYQWICGDEDGNIVIVIDEMFDGVSIAIESLQLRKYIVPSNETYFTVPIMSASSWFNQTTIELKTGIIGDYRIRAGFDAINMIWVFYDGFERVPEQVT